MTIPRDQSGRGGGQRPSAGDDGRSGAPACAGTGTQAPGPARPSRSPAPVDGRCAFVEPGAGRGGRARRRGRRRRPRGCRETPACRRRDAGTGRTGAGAVPSRPRLRFQLDRTPPPAGRFREGWRRRMQSRQLRRSAVILLGSRQRGSTSSGLAGGSPRSPAAVCRPAGRGNLAANPALAVERVPQLPYRSGTDARAPSIR